MNFIEDYFPYAHYFAVIHDDAVDKLTDWGVPDLIANVPSMPIAYVIAFTEANSNIFASLIDYLINNVFHHPPTPIPCNVKE